jgi:hypothetical protein
MNDQKDDCAVRMDEDEWGYWMGMKFGQIGGYRFQGATFGVDGSCKDGRMGSGCCKFQEGGGMEAPTGWR